MADGTRRHFSYMAAQKPQQKPQISKKIQAPTKTFQQDGHWVVKPRKTPILMCDCGNRYLKTRPGQTMCLRCAFKH